MKSFNFFKEQFLSDGHSDELIEFAEKVYNFLTQYIDPGEEQDSDVSQAARTLFSMMPTAFSHLKGKDEILEFAFTEAHLDKLKETILAMAKVDIIVEKENEERPFSERVDEAVENLFGKETVH